ncbi:MAG: HAMP domain-containing protein [Spirochaetes bacterium]|nr:HAMP domain-containing protein [Spirochaetota bacterium]
MKIGLLWKIFFIVTSLLICIIIVALFSYFKISEVNEEVIDLAEYIIPVTDTVSLIDVYVLEQELHLERLIKQLETETPDTAHIQQEFELFEEKGEQVDRELAKAINLADEGKDLSQTQKDRDYFALLVKRLHQIEKEHQDFHDHAIHLINLLKSNNKAEAHKLEDAIEKEEAHFDEEIAVIYRDLHDYSQQTSILAANHQKNILKLNLIMTIAAIFSGFLMAFLFTRGVIGPIQSLMSAMGSVAKGDYSVKIAVNTKDELQHLAQSFNHMIEEMALKARIKSTFGKYVDPRIVENLIDQENLSTGGEKKNMTVIFSEVKQFSEVISGLEVDTQLQLTNRYLSLLSKAVSQKQGVLDKYINTIVMAFWGTPFVEESNHPLLACEAALEQIQTLEEVQKILKQTGVAVEHLKFCCGLATGSVIVGNMGSKNSQSYTVLGDTVNIASRLKGASSQYGVSILVTDETRKQVEGKMLLREIDWVQVLGKEEPISIFELMNSKDKSNNKLNELKINFEQGLDQYRKMEWKSAKECFAACLNINNNDSPSLVFLERIAMLEKKPPAENWTGIWQLTEK